jgi:hypothetical protein
MKALFDGEQWCVVGDDFVSIAESPCEFVPRDSLVGQFIAQLAGESRYCGFGVWGTVIRKLDGEELVMPHWPDEPYGGGVTVTIDEQGEAQA